MLIHMHQQHIASHQLRITAQGSSRHGIGSHPAVAHPQPTLQAEELYRRALTGSRRSAGPRASADPSIRLESGEASGGERLRRRGRLRSAWIRGCRCGKLVEVE